MAKSFFDKNSWELLCQKSASEWSCPEWLTEALKLMGANTEKFKLTEDEQRYIVEFIYPH